MTQGIPFRSGKSLDDVTLFSTSTFLARLDPRDVFALMDALDQVAVPADTTVIAERDEGDLMYFVLDGEAIVTRHDAEIARLRRGDYFGELAILGIRLRSTTVRATSAMRLARLSRSRFLSFSVSHSRAALHVIEALAASLAEQKLAMADDVGVLLRQRTLPRRTHIRVRVGTGGVLDVATGTSAGSLLPRAVEGALVVGATVDHKPVSLSSPLAAPASVEPLTVASWEGRRIFRASVMLLLLEAARRLRPDLQFAAGPRRGDGQLAYATGGDLEAADVRALAERMESLAESGVTLGEELWAVDEARVMFEEHGWHEAAALVPFHRDKTISLVRCGQTFAIGTGPVVEDARFLKGFALFPHEGGILVDFGDMLRPHTALRTSLGLPAVSSTPSAGHAVAMTRELAHWREAMGIRSVGDFNRSCVTGQVHELVRIAEGFHEKHIGHLADRIAGAEGARIVAIAGPSSSGKTTFIRRLKVQLEVDGLVPVHLSLDDYYLDRERSPVDEKGELDFESVEALDRQLFRSQVGRLVAGERVTTARYDFTAGKSLPVGGETMSLGPNAILLVEGLHALAPTILDELGTTPKVRVFIHPASAIAIDRLTVVLPEDVRLLRRIVRDRHQRGISTTESIRRWPSVRRGEERHVFTCLPSADFVFDSSLLYELAVLRVYAERYLLEVDEGDPAYPTAYRLRQLVDRFVPIHDDRVPLGSILREFIGGAGFDD